VQITDEPLSGGRPDSPTAHLPYHQQPSGLLVGEGVSTLIKPGQAIPQPSIPQQLRGQLNGTRTGRRYQRLLRAHFGQLEFLITVHPDVREHVEHALARLRSACRTGTVDAEAVDSASRVLDDLARYGDIAMQRLVGQLREELQCALGRSFDQVLADH
jgi:hypothetical protein